MIQIRNLTKRYRRHEALHQLSFDVPEGSAFALIGANGAGKTTTLKILMNMLQPDSGEAIVLETNSRSLSPAQLAQIGYVSESQQLPDGLSVDAFFHYLRPMYPHWDLPLETNLRRQFRLPGTFAIRNLSHGAQMKLKLAAALSFRPRLLILDEPLGGLDPLSRDEVLEGFLPMAGETTVLISSHELSEIESTLTHVAYLEEGRLRFAEPLADLGRRFRSVQVVLPAAPPTEHHAPSHWTNVQFRGNVAHFVDTAYNSATFHHTVESAFGEARSIDVQPMGLREIFVALARQNHSTQTGRAS